MKLDIIILERLTSRGVNLSVAGNKLLVEAPRGVLNAEIREWLARHKPEILRLLQSPTVRAKVRDEEKTAETTKAEIYWHCHGQKSCRCALCAVPALKMRWVEGECAACLGTGHLVWPATIQ